MDSQLLQRRTIPSCRRTTASLAGYSPHPVLLSRAAASLLLQVRSGICYARVGIGVTELRPVGAQPIFEQFIARHEAKHIGSLLELEKHAHDPLL